MLYAAYILMSATLFSTTLWLTKWVSIRARARRRLIVNGTERSRLKRYGIVASALWLALLVGALPALAGG